MTLQEAQALIQTGIAAAVAPLKLAEAKREAHAEATRILESVTLPQAAKDRIADRAVATITEAYDAAKFREVVVNEAKAEGKYLAQITGSGRVVGMGNSSPFAAPLTEAQIEDERKRDKRERKHLQHVREAGTNTFLRLMGGNKEAAEAAASKGRAA